MEHGATWNRKKQLYALTLWQPWAWAVGAGLRLVDFRAFIPSHRLLVPGDDLVIHAGQHAASQSDWLTVRSKARALGRHQEVPPYEVAHHSLVRGACIAVVRYDGVARGAAELTTEQRVWWAPTANYGWKFSNVRQLREALPCRGQPDVWAVDGLVEERLYRALSQPIPADPTYGTWRRTAA